MRGRLALLVALCLWGEGHSAISRLSQSSRRSSRKVWPLLTAVDGHSQRCRAANHRDRVLYDFGSMPSTESLFRGLVGSEEVEARAAQHMDNCLPTGHDFRDLLLGDQDAFIVEVGAFSGDDTVLYAQWAKKVLAFEPGPAKSEHVQQRIEALRGQGRVRGNVTVVEAAASDHVRSDVSMYLPQIQQSTRLYRVGDSPGESGQDSLHDQAFWADAIPGSNQQVINISTVKIDDLVHEHVHYMEVDVQGHDFAALRGAERVISEFGVGVIRVEFAPLLLTRAGEDPVEFLHWLADHGYVCFDTPPFHLDDTPEEARVWSWNWKTRLQRGQPLPQQGPVMFQDYVDAILAGTFMFHNVNVGIWRDLVCFQS
jgi:FkbM family methyltransferase